MANSKRGRKAASNKTNNRRNLKNKRKPRRSIWALIRLWLGLLIVAALIVGGLYMLWLDRQVQTKFEGSRWALPAQVYAQPLELYPGKRLSVSQMADELLELGYRKQDKLAGPGTFRQRREVIELHTRRFKFWDGEETEKTLKLSFSGPTLMELENTATKEAVLVARLDPLHVGSISPAKGEDRLLVRLQDVPEQLVNTLLITEDQHFYEHMGVDLIAIARAAVANISAGRVVQGGSTLTQQLVKNFFLSNERTFSRKINEAAMAFLLELRYSKDEILEAYLNELYLGQEGDRAIHGIGLGSYFYFRKPVSELAAHEIAMMVGIVKGPSYYDPRRRKERALKRRNLVIGLMERNELLDQADAQRARVQPLKVAKKANRGTSRYPAFMEQVRKQLSRDYRESDLQTEGLRIFTTLDPLVQRRAEKVLAKQLDLLEKQNKIVPDTLQGAVLVTSVEGGEVLAIVGDRNADYAGFNRVLDAKRPVGSLLKPALYLAALNRPEQYNLATYLDDVPLTIQQKGSKPWSPQNYDKRFRGVMPLYEALVRSANVPAVNLGMELGIENLISTLQALGMEQSPAPYPSLVLGAVPMSPLEVGQIYHTLAAGGFRTPMQSIRSVLTVDGEPLQRYSLVVERVAEPEPVYLVNRVLQQVMQVGTGVRAKRYLSTELEVAGKTGTTNDLRDSWFAGFTGNHTAVVWVGRDDNASIGLTGGQGALPIWAKIMAGIGTQAFVPSAPEQVTEIPLLPDTLQRAGLGCENVIWLPFIQGSAPKEEVHCVETAPVVEPSPPKPSRPAPQPEAAPGVLDVLRGIFQ